MSEDVTLDDFSHDEAANEGQDVPTDDWREARITDLCEIEGGSTPKKSNSDYWENGDILWTTPKDFTGPRLTDTEDKITEQGAEESTSKIYPPGTTLLVVRSGVLRHSLPVAMVEEATTVNQDLKALQPDREQVNAEYFFQALSGLSEDIRGSCKKTGTTVESIQTNVLKQYPVPVPSKAEQRKIATVLYNIDQAIEKAEEIGEQVEIVKKGLAQELLHSGIGNPDTTEEWMGEVPAHWDVRELSELVELSQNGIYIDSDDYGGPYPIIKMGDIFGGVTLDEPIRERVHLDEDEIDKYATAEGDLVFARHAQAGWGAGDCTYVPEMDETAVVESNMVQVRLNDEIDPMFYAQYFNSEIGVKSIKRITTTGNIKSISQGDLMNLKVPVPPREEQEEIAETLSVFDEQAEHSESEVERLRRLKQGLMQDLLSGKVRTTDTNIEVPEEIAQHG